VTAQPIEANVVLTADNSGYDQSMAASSQATSTLIDSVDKLTARIGKLTKTAGKSLIGIAAADVAVITGATAAWSSYEKQVERLKSQAAVLGRGTEQQNKVMKDYGNTVKALRSEMGTTTTEAAKLTETLSKVTNLRQTRDLTEMSKVFVQMSKATGESSQGLASSLTNLEKIMGTPVNAQNSKKYADTFTYLAAQTNTSAQGLMDFTAQLAPVAKQLNMSTNDVAGFATAFTQAGQDTGAAATAFTKVSTDMLRSLQSGSPELATYANIVGTTSENFQKLAKKDSAEAVVRVFEALSKNTKTASADLERLGLDGPRTIRAITGLTNQPGGIRAAMGLAEDPNAKNAAGRGYEATLKGLSNQFDELREDLKQTAEAFAVILGPAVEGFLTGLEKAASIMQNIAQGPIGKFLQVVMGLVAPLAGGAGALLLFAGALVKVAGAFLLLRNSMTRGAVEGFKGGAGLTRAADGSYVARGGGALGTTGRQLAEGPSTWVQRGMYNAGQFAGAGLGSFRRGGAVPESYYAAREAASRAIPWTKDYQRPTAPQSPLAMLSRGAGYAVSNFLTPQFDQMRYANPTQRTQWAAQEAPWIRSGESMRTAAGRVQLIPGLASAMGRVGLADTQLKAQRAETVRIHQDPMLTDQSRQARLMEMRQLREETIQRRNAALVQESSIRQEITQRGESAKATKAASQETKTFGQAMRGLGRAVGGGIAGAGAAGFGALQRSGMMGQAAGLTATVAGGAMGSNALMMGGTGAMIGSMLPGPGTAIGAVVGGGVGLTMDAAKANDNITESIKQLDAAATQTTKTGGGLVELHNITTESTKQFGDYEKSMTSWRQKGLGPLESITTGYGQIKNWTEGLFGGRSDVEEAQEGLDKTAEKAKNAEAAFRDLAVQGGVKLEGSATQQRQQIDEFMQSRGVAALGQADIEVEDFVKARKDDEAKYDRMLSAAITPGKATGMQDRMRASGQFGQIMLDDKTMQKSIALQGDISLAYEATNGVFEKMRDSGMSYLDIVRQGEKAQAEAGEEGVPEYIRGEALVQKAQYALQMQAPQLGRVGAVQQQLQLTQAVLATSPQTPTDAAQREEQKQAAVQAMGDQDQYFRSMILAQRSYERSRVRAQDDFQMQRMFQEHDYNLSRQRAEESFHRQRGRAIADYHRNVRRGWSDFNLQRKRQEEDYQHQIELTAQQRATSMNLYARPETQRTSSATWLLSNTKSILGNLREQKRNLNRLRALGISDAVIQQLQLTDPANAQELTRFVHELESDRGMVGRFNRVSSQLQRASKALVTDPSGADFKEMQRSFTQGRERGMDDMQRSMKRGHNDFWRGLKQQKTDFNIMMEDQAEDYDTQMERQLTQYELSMDRAAEDMGHMADEVLGSITDVMVTAQEELTGSAKKQATAALKSFKDLRSSTKPEAVALMRELSTVFGFEYTNPLHGGGGGGGGASGRGASNYTRGQGTNAPAQSAPNYNTYWAGGYGSITHPSNYFTGGMIPGWTPGRDTMQVNVSGGEAVMRPEWARAVGKEAIDQMNHQARHGGYWMGGTIPLRNASVSRHTSGYSNYAADMNYPGYSDFGKPIVAWKAGIAHPFDLGSDRSYGRGQSIAHEGNQSSLYAHMSRVVTGLAGKHVRAGQVIGYVGDYGNTGSPPTSHLHFEIRGGQINLGNAGSFGGAAASGAGVGASARYRDVMKRLYPQSEAAAKAMTGVHPLVHGDISDVINRYGRRAFRRMNRQAVAQAGNVGTGLGELAAPAPEDVNGAVALGRRMAAARGWTGNQWNALYQLWQHESGWRWNADNPSSSAYGIPQALPGSKMASAGADWKTNPATQIKWGMNYIAARPDYGSPAKAWSAWQSRSPHWYQDGSVFTSPNQIGVGENGPEAVIPLNQKGGEFLARSIGLNSAPMGGGGSMSIANYKIDRSTNFTGPITVQANDPNELLAKLQARQRVRALTRPAVSGSAA